MSARRAFLLEKNIIQQNSINLNRMGADRWQIIKPSGLSDDTYTTQSSYSQFLVTAATLDICN